MGGYDHGRQAGVVHVGRNQIVAGAKLWEWGTGPEGRAWDKVLTDDDGPYAELMVGAFSDNQPDYSWIQPGEVKRFQQFWYPVRDIGGFKNANRDAAVNLELRTNGMAWVGFHPTAVMRQARVLLRAGNRPLLDETVNLTPAKPFCREIPVAAATLETELRASLLDADGREVIAYQPVKRAPVESLPRRVEPPRAPQDIASADELYLTGLRIEQIHNPSVDPVPYYEEVVRRDAGDSRANTRLAIHALRRGQYAEAEQRCRTALTRATAEYTRPEDAAAHYYLGLALAGQERLDEAYDQFYRASWDAAFHSAASVQVAGISCRRGDFALALEQVRDVLRTGAWNTKAMGLEAVLLRKLGRIKEAVAAAARALAIDPLDFLAANEQDLARSRPARRAGRSARNQLETLMRGEVESYLELATDYLQWGLWDEAIDVLRRPVEARRPGATTYPLVYYYLGYLEEQKGATARAAARYAQAAQCPPDYCFPFRLETAAVLQAALRVRPADARAQYYLGNLYYDLQPGLAMDCWTRARTLDDSLAAAHRNLGWAYYRTKNDLTNAVACYEAAIAREARDPRWFLELDQLYELGNADPQRRLTLLEQHQPVVRQRMESFTRLIALQVLCGQYDAAIGHLTTNFFAVREGGGEIHDVYVDAHLLRGIECLRTPDAAAALRHFQKASEYPENLSVGRPKNDRRAAQVGYHRGLAQEALGQAEAARQSFAAAAAQSGTEEWPEARFYQALCRRKLGETEPAEGIFTQLVERGTQELARGESSDFFAKFGEQETRQTRAAAAHYTLGLGRLGLGDGERAHAEFEQAVRLNRSHVWAKYHLAQ